MKGERYAAPGQENNCCVRFPGTGTDVVDPQRTRLGRIDSIVLDLASGYISYLVVQPGTNDRLVHLPFSTVQGHAGRATRHVLDIDEGRILLARRATLRTRSRTGPTLSSAKALRPSGGPCRQGLQRRGLNSSSRSLHRQGLSDHPRCRQSLSASAFRETRRAFPVTVILLANVRKTAGVIEKARRGCRNGD